MPRPVCVSCQRFFRPKTNGFYWVEGKPTEYDTPSGKERPDLWVPYKLWMGDLWQCQGCGVEIVVGHGLNPISQDYVKGFAQSVRDVPLQVNDC